MKKLVLLLTILIATCSAKALPLIPTGNYFYLPRNQAELIYWKDRVDLYSITTQNLREVKILKFERDYYKEETEKARFNSSLNWYYGLGGLIIGWFLFHH